MAERSFFFETSEGLTVRGEIHSAGAGRAPVVVCVHGFKGFKDWGFWPETARRLSAAGYGVVRFNFSHSGIGADSENFSETRLFETGTYSREVEDLGEVLNRLTAGRLNGAEDLDATRIALLAHSRGAVSALAAAAGGEFPIRSVALWNPVSSVIWWDEETRRRWRQDGFWEVVNSRTRQVFRMDTALLDDAEHNRERLRPVASAARLNVPLLVVVAGADETVPPASGQRLVSSAGPRGTLVEIPDSSHTFGAAHPFAGSTPALEEAWRVTREHFDRTLTKATV